LKIFLVLDKSENLVISQKELFVTRTLEESRAKSESSRVNVVGTHFFIGICTSGNKTHELKPYIFVNGCTTCTYSATLSISEPPKSYTTLLLLVPGICRKSTALCAALAVVQ